MADDIFPSDVRDAANKITSPWIRGEEFEGNGLVLQFAKKMEKIVPRDPQHGATDQDFLVKNGVLPEGQVFRYTFNTPDGRVRHMDSKSSPLFLGFKMVEELGVGDWVQVVRTGKSNKTRYTVVKVDRPADAVEVKPQAAYPEEDIDADLIPF